MPKLAYCLSHCYAGDCCPQVCISWITKYKSKLNAWRFDCACMASNNHIVPSMPSIPDNGLHPSSRLDSENLIHDIIHSLRALRKEVIPSMPPPWRPASPWHGNGGIHIFLICCLPAFILFFIHNVPIPSPAVFIIAFFRPISDLSGPGTILYRRASQHGTTKGTQHISKEHRPAFQHQPGHLPHEELCRPLAR